MLPEFPKGGALTVTGNVRDRSTLKPIAIFSVFLGDGKRSMVGQRLPGGRFRIRGVSLGGWSLLVSATGYESYSRKIEARLGTKVKPLEVLLGEGMQIRGKVTAPEGVNLTGAAFTLAREDGFGAGYTQV